MPESPPYRLFSYGTFRLEQVQTKLFGRLVPTTPDALVGWRVEEVEIDDPAVVAASGRSRHPILIRSGDAADRVEGAVLSLNTEDLLAADAYEVSAYVRMTTLSEAGVAVEVYVLAT